MTLHLNVQCVVYLEVLVIAKHIDNGSFTYYVISRVSKCLRLITGGGLAVDYVITILIFAL